VQVEAGVLGQPLLHVDVFVGVVVVQDQVDLQAVGNLAVDGAQEFEELLVAVAGQTLPDHHAGQHVQRREQVGGAVALVVVGVCPERGGEFDVGRAC